MLAHDKEPFEGFDAQDSPSIPSEFCPDWGYIGGGTARLINTYLNRSTFSLNDYDREILRSAKEFLDSASVGYRLVSSEKEAFPENSIECTSAFYAAIRALAAILTKSTIKDRELNSKLKSYAEIIAGLLSGTSPRRGQMLKEAIAFFRGLSRASEDAHYAALCSEEEKSPWLRG